MAVPTHLAFLILWGCTKAWGAAVRVLFPPCCGWVFPAPPGAAHPMAASASCRQVPVLQPPLFLPSTHAVLSPQPEGQRLLCVGPRAEGKTLAPTPCGQEEKPVGRR